MTSQIDPTQPVEGTPTTASVRQNFQTAHDEITALQTSVGELTASEVAISPAIGALGANVQTALTTLDNTSAPIRSPQFQGDPQAPTAAYGDNDQSLSTTAFVQSAVTPALNDTSRNFIPNGRFKWWQRGTSFSGAGYTADRWRLAFSGDTGITVAQGVATDGMRTAVNDESWNYYHTINFVGGAASANYTLFSTYIEGVRRLAGKTVTLSFFGWSNPGSLQVGLIATCNFGTGGSPSPSAGIQIGLVPLAVSVQRFAKTFVMPTSIGATFGTNGDDNILLQFFCSVGAGSTGGPAGMPTQSGAISIWGVQLEPGVNASPLAPAPDSATELAQMQRFYEIINITQDLNSPSQATPVTYAMRSYKFATQKRNAPSIQLSNITYYSAGSVISMPSPQAFTTNGSMTCIGSNALTNAQGFAGGAILASSDY